MTWAGYHHFPCQLRMWDAIKDFTEWIADVAEHIIETIVDTIRDLINPGVSDSIKYTLYLLNKLLFALYRSFRDVLVYVGYTLPFTEQQNLNIAVPFSVSSLRKSMGSLRECILLKKFRKRERRH